MNTVIDLKGRPGEKWPPELRNLFIPIRLIGKGSFGGVWSARMNQKAQKLIGENVNLTHDEVAIKRINIATPLGKSYATREIKILKNMHHPNIIHSIQAFDSSDSLTQCIVMSMANGPSLFKLLNEGGALSLKLTRRISQHLVSALSYMHTRAVIYRDLKPDNVIIVGAVAENMSIFHKDNEDDESKQCIQCQAIIVDLGLARALTEADLKKNLKRRKRYMLCCLGSDISFERNICHSKAPSKFRRYLQRSSIIRTLDQPLKPLPQRGLTRDEGEVTDDFISKPARKSLIGQAYDASFESTERTLSYDESDSLINFLEQRYNDVTKQSRKSSLSRTKQRLSIVGSKGYCAPEVTQNIIACYKDTKNVSEYGMLADSFSLGCVIREMITGAPPFMSVENLLIAHKKKLESNKQNSFPLWPKKEFMVRSCNLVPQSASNLIRNLTNKETHKRITIRSAQTHHYILDTTSLMPKVDIPTKEGDPIVYIE